MLTPIDIHNKEFKKSFRGYSENDVDDFLDQVVNDYEKLYRDNEQLRAKIARSEKDVEQYKKLEKNLQDTLLVAQRTAEEVTSAAKKFSVEVRESAAKECQNMKLRSELEAQKRTEMAEIQAKKLIEEAELASKRNLDEAIGKVRAIVAEYDRLVREKNRFLLTVRSTLESELSILNQTIDGLPHPEQSDPPVNQEEAKAEPEPVPVAQEQAGQGVNKPAGEEKNVGDSV